MYEGDAGKERAPTITSETVGVLFDRIVSDPAVVREGGDLADAVGGSLRSGISRKAYVIDWGGEGGTLAGAVDAILRSGITRKAYVIDSGGKLLGTVTIETLMKHVGYRLGARPLGVISWFRFLRDMESDGGKDFMAKPAPVTKDTPVIEIVRRVADEHLNDFPVGDQENRLLGEVNTFNLLKITRDVFGSSASDQT